MAKLQESLKGVFRTSGKLHDVCLSHEDLIWTAQQNALNSGSRTQIYTVSTRAVKLKHVIGAWISKQQNSKSGNEAGQLAGFSVFFYQCKKQRMLKQASVTFESLNETLCQLWVVRINKILKGFHERPQNLKIIINPYARQGKAPNLYFKKIAPLFEKAGILTDVLMTERAGHAWEYLRTADMSSFDGVVCVGGDGIAHEVVNGLLEKAHIDAGIDIVKGKLPQDFKAVKLPVRIGIIPAGSTDVIVYSAQGINDPVTSALHIIIGNSQPLDICSLEDSDNKLVRFSFSLAYGFLGDVLKSSEQSRWMGPRRYKWAATKRLGKLKTYEVEITYLPSRTRDQYHPRDNTRCRKGCEVCAKPDCEEMSDAPDGQKDTQPLDERQVFRGRVVGASLITLPSPCDISPDGPSPSCHLGDGHTDLIIVKQCSKPQMYAHIQRNFSSKDQFEFDFVETHRVRECHIRACSASEPEDAGNNGAECEKKITPETATGRKDRSVGVWNADGELLRKSALLARVHRQLVSVFGDGIEDEPRPVGCIPKFK